jgi:hypothetical protein
MEQETPRRRRQSRSRSAQPRQRRRLSPDQAAAKEGKEEEKKQKERQIVKEEGKQPKQLQKQPQKQPKTPSSSGVSSALSQWTVARLRSELRSRRLPVGGRKDELLERLLRDSTESGSSGFIASNASPSSKWSPSKYARSSIQFDVISNKMLYPIRCCILSIVMEAAFLVLFLDLLIL